LQTEVRVASRQLTRSSAVCAAIKARIPQARLEPVAIASAEELGPALDERSLVVAAGTAGVVLLPRAVRAACQELKVAIDLNAVPPLGIEGVETGDRGVSRDGVTVYGALGVGAAKMKLHKAAIARIFESSDQVLDAEEVFALAGG
jgi:hypothetical protein